MPIEDRRSCLFGNLEGPILPSGHTCLPIPKAGPALCSCDFQTARDLFSHWLTIISWISVFEDLRKL